MTCLFTIYQQLYFWGGWCENNFKLNRKIERSKKNLLINQKLKKAVLANQYLYIRKF